MRLGLVRNVGLSITALAVIGLGGCNDDPLDFDVKDTKSVQANPSEMVVPAGRTADLESRALNEGLEPTFDPVTAQVDRSCEFAAGSATFGEITVVPDPDQLPVQPPGLFEVTGGSTLGPTCINLSAGSASTTVNVTVVADAIAIVSAPALLRAGETATIVAQLQDFNGGEVLPYDPADAAWSSDDSDVVAVDATGGVTTNTAGTATVTVTWSGQDSNRTSGLGVVRSADATIEVIPNVPASAALDNNNDFGALAGGAQATSEVVVLDALGNQNTDETEITGCTVNSSDVAVATATCDLVPGSVHVIVTVTAVGPGSATIDGTVQTVSGPLAFGPAPVTVLQPTMTAITPDNGDAAATAVITGSGLSAAGFATTVLVNGSALNNITVDSDTQITAQMPTLAAGTYDVVVDVGGVQSNTLTWTQNNPFDESEPLNDFEATAPDASFPMNFTGVADAGEVVQAFGHYDLYGFTLSQPGTINVTLTWDNVPADLDVYIWDRSLGQPDGTFGTFPTGWMCGAAGGSGGGGFQPETTGDCSLPAGDYLVWIYDFGPGTSNYTVVGTFTPTP